MSVPGALRPKKELPVSFVGLKEVVEQLIDSNLLNSRAEEISRAHGFQAALEEILSLCFLLASARLADPLSVRVGIAHPQIPRASHLENRACTARPSLLLFNLALGVHLQLVFGVHRLNPSLAVSGIRKRSGQHASPSLLACGIPLPRFSAPL